MLLEGTPVHRTEGHDHNGAAGITEDDVGSFVYVLAKVVMHTDDRVFQTGYLETSDITFIELVVHIIMGYNI